MVTTMANEINLLFPQSPAAEAELQNIMTLQHQIVTRQGSKPVVRLIHDAIVTACLVDTV